MNLKWFTWPYLNLPEFTWMGSLGFTWVHFSSLQLILADIGHIGGFGTYKHTYIHLDIFTIYRDPIGSNNGDHLHNLSWSLNYWVLGITKAIYVCYIHPNLSEYRICICICWDIQHSLQHLPPTPSIHGSSIGGESLNGALKENNKEWFYEIMKLWFNGLNGLETAWNGR